MGSFGFSWIFFASPPPPIQLRKFWVPPPIKNLETKPWILTLLRSHVWLYPRITVSKSHGNTSKNVATVIIFWNFSTISMTLGETWPHFCWGHICNSTKDHCVQVPWKYIKVCGYRDHFLKTLSKRSMTPSDPRWPLTPLLLRSHVRRYLRVIV